MVYKVWSKNNCYFKFFQKNIYLFINNYLICFKVTSSDIIHLCQSFFQSSIHFWNAPVSIFLVFPKSWQNVFLSSVFSVLGRGKSYRRPSPVNTVVDAWLRFCFWPKTYAQAFDLRSLNGFSIILCVSDKPLASRNRRITSR